MWKKLNKGRKKKRIKGVKNKSGKTKEGIKTEEMK
jgi:hypothetical protein